MRRAATCCAPAPCPDWAASTPCRGYSLPYLACPQCLVRQPRGYRDEDDASLWAARNALFEFDRLAFYGSGVIECLPRSPRRATQRRCQEPIGIGGEELRRDARPHRVAQDMRTGNVQVIQERHYILAHLETIALR